MATRSFPLALLAGALALGLSSAASADSASAEMLANTCAGCHGTRGASVGPATPIIGHMERETFKETMKAFQEDEMYGTIMNRIAKGYTEEEIEKMADYFFRQEYVPAKQPFNEKLVRKGEKLHRKYCEKCHEDGGRPVEGEDVEYALLAGQWTPYLRYTMEDFRNHRREMPKKMKKKIKRLLRKEGEKGLEALFAYYASQQ